MKRLSTRGAARSHVSGRIDRNPTIARELHLIAPTFADDPPILICPRCDTAFVVRPDRPNVCPCGAKPCGGCAHMLAARASS